ncbi:hypothetical protein [Kibdelosporangium phytohabitans]|uniref:hypothetical protein n=1 Tax=Kibdelosporangium phytohabitans TaxID=860235 RepID=UPI0012F91BB5|nr:hypothetical protein [Kibdelosporangium phytohabitans]MBE1461418.1 hypothetical protein [Kibdelosporangium phytohabitans]
MADLPAESPAEVWESFAAAVPKGKRPLRLVPGRRPREIGPHVGQWLSERIGRVVLAPYGLVHPGTAGVLFVHSVANSGWLWFQRGQVIGREAKRFPRPAWDSPAVAEVVAAGVGGVAEPLPAGLWIRPEGDTGTVSAARTKLVKAVPCHPGALVIVLGCPGAGDLALSNVAAIWQTLPDDIRATARFARFGGLVLPQDGSTGQALADVLNAEVRCYTGLPTGSAEALDVLTLRPDGSYGWNTFAQGFAYRPRTVGGTPEPPRLWVCRPPIADLPEASPGVYRYTSDTVIEVVESGLWIRPGEGDAGPSDARTVPLDPAGSLVVYESADPAQADHLRTMAESLLDRLDHSTVLTTTVVPTTALTSRPKAEAVVAARPVSRPQAGNQTRPAVAEEPVTEVLVRNQVRRAGAERPGGREGVDSVVPERPVNRMSIKERLEPAATGGGHVDEPADTKLPLLSRMMDTLTVPAPDFSAEPGSLSLDTDDAPTVAVATVAAEQQPRHESDWLRRTVTEELDRQAGHAKS